MAEVCLPLYRVVDEDLISKFPDSQKEYMKDFYYSLYVKYCDKIKKKKRLEKSAFFSNMRRRKIKIIQICCPYCGEIRSIVVAGSIQNTLGHFNYCYNCGKPSTKEHVSRTYSRLTRIVCLHRLGIAKLMEVRKVDDIKLYTYDILQLELVEIESTFESLMRELYTTLLYLKYRNVKDSFLQSLIEKDVANDFLNVAKANTHFKKALGINLKSELDTEDWKDLIDLVELRNTIVHNDGMADKRFKKSETYQRVKHMINGDLIFVSPEDISRYLKKAFLVLDFLNQKLSEEFENNAPALIANSVFNRAFHKID